MDQIARQYSAIFRSENKFHGDVAKARIDGHEVWLLKPMTYMNLSGQAVATLCRFYKIAPEAILVVHDELDLPAGTARLKKSGGHGGHNGLRDTIAHLGVNTFNRLRLGIDHPGSGRDVPNYVLKNPSAEQRAGMEAAIDNAMAVLPAIVRGEWQTAMQQLHSQ